MTGTIYPKEIKTKYKIISIKDSFSFIKYRLKYLRHIKFGFISFTVWLNVGLEDNRARYALEKFVKDHTKVEEYFIKIAKLKKKKEREQASAEKTTYYN